MHMKLLYIDKRWTTTNPVAITPLWTWESSEFCRPYSKVPMHILSSNCFHENMRWAMGINLSQVQG